MGGQWFHLSWRHREIRHPDDDTSEIGIAEVGVRLNRVGLAVGRDGSGPETVFWVLD
jgi:hypothetical protein